ncbi:hypothetical protein SAMN04488500_12660 [Sporomusa malonica]|uniref:Uncharacterized protein n=1 Tax=Sporomusa malonica TaxID=112901 RepID=A0A1W2EP63_9FIRM|nr:hypothetical protein SAMN04488500_12660 [Sporomusa malonica]
MDLDSKIYVARSRGLVGSAILRRLKNSCFLAAHVFIQNTLRNQ